MNDPIDIFTGTILIIAPHMDDEALACGGLMARLPDKSSIHLVYATDGMKSPAPVFPARDRITSDLGEIRIQESIKAMTLLGVPRDNLVFLRLPEAELSKYKHKLRAALLTHIVAIHPQFIFIPFRYDRHPDHLIINQIIVDAYHQQLLTAQIVEYFVYYRSRLLSLRDIRKYIGPEHRTTIDIGDVASQKRAALDCFTSQTTIFYPWQTRVILTSQLLDEECAQPEHFVLYNRDFPRHAIFSHSIACIRIAHRIEPTLQKAKYLIGSYFKRLVKNGS